MSVYPPGPRPRVLVAFASRHGATREIAATIVRCLHESEVGRSAGLSAVLAPVQRAPDLAHFDAVVLGSAIYAGRWLEPARRFAETMAPELCNRSTWLFSSGLVGGPPGLAHDVDDARRIGGLVRARAHRVFPGRLERRLLSSVEQCLWSRGPAAAGDFRDWSAVRGWSEGIVADLVSRPAMPVGAMTS